MASCAVHIRLEGNATTFRGEDSVRGTVLVRAEKDVRLRGVALTLRWETEGTGNRVRDTSPELRVGEECELNAGDERVFPFTMQLPAGPVSYTGHLFAVKWMINAEADVAMGINPDASLPLTVLANERAGEEALGPAFKRASILNAQRMNAGRRMGCSIMLALLFASAFFLGGALVPDWDHPADDELMIALGLFAGGLLVFAAIAVGPIRNRLRGRFEAAIDNPILARGQTLRATARFTPRRPVHVAAISIRIEQREQTRYNAGKHSKVRTQTMHKDESATRIDETLQAGMLREITASIPLPADRLHTIAIRDNTLEWRAFVCIEFASGKPVELDYPIAVLP